jgi:16S rRNA (cytosine1402-N4)-methyltransferase
MTYRHIPVLLRETIEVLECAPGQTLVDATIGGAGHSRVLVQKVLPDGCLIGIDQDNEALEASRIILGPFMDNVTLIQGNFKDMKSILKEHGIEGVDRILMDLGVSSYQLDTPERGFSHNQNGPLDMRMDTGQDLTAADVVNTYPEEDIGRILKEYGEERWAKRIASFIVKNRPIETTEQLTTIIKQAIPAGARREGPHPAKRTFQALRIEVNQELAILPQALRDAVDMLAPQGRLAVITFHSLEDRLVKNTFVELEKPCTCPPDAPVCICDKQPAAKRLTRKPVTAGAEELERNPRARSAKLRAVEKLALSVPLHK